MNDPIRSARRKGVPGDFIVNHRDGSVRTLSHRKDADDGWWLLEGGGLHDGVHGWTTVRRARMAAAFLAFCQPRPHGGSSSEEKA